MKSSVNGRRARRQRRRPRDRDGYRLAAIRGLTGARLVLKGECPTLRAAAMRCGSCIPYVQGGLALLQSENVSLLVKVAKGEVPLLAAARETRRLGALVAAYRAASASDRVAFARAVGPTTLFDNSLVPAL